MNQITTAKSAPADLALTTTKTESRVDTRILAQHLGNKHKPVIALIERYADKFKAFGQLSFKKAVGERKQGGGNAERYALLNEDQAYLLLNLSRNSDRVVELKVRLVKAFGEARRASDLRQQEYLPAYHELHNTVAALASGSSHERHVHQNFNKLMNKVAGIEAGQRARANLPKQSMLIVAQMMAAQALQSAPDHRVGFQLAKAAVEPLLALTTSQRLGVGNG